MVSRDYSYVVINSDYACFDSDKYGYSYPYTVINRAKINSQGNPGYRNLGRSSGDVGSGFLLEKSTMSTSLKRTYIPGMYSGGGYFRGIQLPVAPGSTTMQSGMTLPAFGATEQAALLAMGTTAIARTLPTNPTSGVLQFAGELYRDGIPSIVGSGLLKSRLKDYRELGSEYLNVEFGWKPFIRDIQNIARAVKDSEKILSQFRRDSGQLIHRRYRFPSYTETSVIPRTGAVPWPGTGAYGKQYFGGAFPYGYYTGYTTKSVDTWYEGCYRFYYPLGDSQIDRMKRFSSEANKLLGLRLTPEVIWDLTPWTWLGDWVSNLGDVIHNVSALNQDNLVIKYGYIMQHTKYEREVRMDLAIPRKDGVSVYDLKLINERKVRMKASPYGFGLTWDGFSTRQWSILGAIGISNSRKTSK